MPDASTVFFSDTESIRHQRPSRSTGGSAVIFQEDFRGNQPGVWNDGVGFIGRDCDVMFNGRPTLRLDTGAQSNTGATNPGRTAATNGVVVKRRIHSNYNERIGMEGWFRFSSLNNTSNSLLSMSIYNRNGASAFHGRVWLNPNGNNQPMLAQILDGTATINAGSGTNPALAGTYTTVSTSTQQYGAGTHTYDVPTGRLDRAGGWHYIKLVVDFANNTYVSLQLDGMSPVSLTNYTLDITDSTGFAGMHCSWEYSGTTTTRRFVHVANMVVTKES